MCCYFGSGCEDWPGLVQPYSKCTLSSVKPLRMNLQALRTPYTCERFFHMVLFNDLAISKKWLWYVMLKYLNKAICECILNIIKLKSFIFMVLSLFYSVIQIACDWLKLIWKSTVYTPTAHMHIRHTIFLCQSSNNYMLEWASSTIFTLGGVWEEEIRIPESQQRWGIDSWNLKMY